MRKRILSFIMMLFLVSAVTPLGANAMDATTAMSGSKKVKNVIVLIPDGMSIGGVTLTRWYNAFDSATGTVDTNKKLAIDEMASGLIRTYWSANGVVGAITDSAPAATAFATGHKTNDKYIAVNDKKEPVATILEAAKLNGLSTGLIATSQVQHATPADYSGHYPDRSKEEIIAEQQVYNNIDVVFGGGAKRLTARVDNENLIEVLKTNGYSYITKAQELKDLKGKAWGLFAPIDMAYEMDRKINKPEEPSLAEMTNSAIKLLAQNKKGFFLMVEGSKVDWAAHANDPIGIISDVNAFDAAVKVALDYAKNNKDTMVLVMTDHGNGGITIGDINTTKSYSSDPVSRFIAPLKKAVLTGEGLEAKFNKDMSNIKDVMKTYYGIDDLTKEEEDAIKKTKPGTMNYTVGPMISKRANIGWTTGGHTGEEIVLYSYLPGNERITGLMENTDIAKICASFLGVSLKNTTEELFVQAEQAFKNKNAAVKLDRSDINNTKLIVTKGKDTLEIFESKNYVLLNGQKVAVKGVSLNILDKFYVSKDTVDLIK